MEINIIELYIELKLSCLNLAVSKQDERVLFR